MVRRRRRGSTLGRSGLRDRAIVVSGPFSASRHLRSCSILRSYPILRTCAAQEEPLERRGGAGAGGPAPALGIDHAVNEGHEKLGQYRGADIDAKQTGVLAPQEEAVQRI